MNGKRKILHKMDRWLSGQELRGSWKEAVRGSRENGEVSAEHWKEQQRINTYNYGVSERD